MGRFYILTQGSVVLFIIIGERVDAIGDIPGVLDKAPGERGAGAARVIWGGASDIWIVLVRVGWNVEYVVV